MQKKNKSNKENHCPSKKTIHNPSSNIPPQFLNSKYPPLSTQTIHPVQQSIKSLEASLQKQTINEVSSSIQMLKKRALMLQKQDQLGTVVRMSTCEGQIKQNQVNILKTLDMNQENNSEILPKHKYCENAINPEEKRNKKNNRNFRKVVKGRPQLYNWVRKYKRELSDKYNILSCGDSQTENLKTIESLKLWDNQKQGENKQRRNSSSTLIHNYTNKIRLRNCQTSKNKGNVRGATFLERLKTLQDNRKKVENEKDERFCNPKNHQKVCHKVLSQHIQKIASLHKIKTRTEA